MEQHQLLTLLEMQDAMNSKVNSDWRERNHEWYRAIWVECAEMLDHYGWKWWKHQECDFEQVKLELIDILHFGLSDLIVQHDSMEALAKVLSKHWPKATESGDFKLLLEEFTLDTLQTKHFNLNRFVELAYSIGLSSEDIYVGYIGKNVLNIFRQDYGYKSGEYIKVWNGREDNEVLVELCDKLDSSDAQFKDQLYSGLADAYPS